MFGDASPPHLERPAAALSRRGARMDGVRAVVRMRTLTAWGPGPRSPNFARLVYDGDVRLAHAVRAVRRPVRTVIERAFNEYFATRGLATEPTAFDGRSDYGPFIDVGIPPGAVRRVPRGSRRRNRPPLYGGGRRPHDPCYHHACDDIDNLSPVAGPDERRRRARHDLAGAEHPSGQRPARQGQLQRQGHRAAHADREHLRQLSHPGQFTAKTGTPATWAWVAGQALERRRPRSGTKRPTDCS